MIDRKVARPACLYGDRRRVSMGTDPSVVLPGTEVEVEADPGLSVTPSSTTVPAPGSRGYSSIRVLVRAPASAEPGARLVVLAAAGESTCEREVLIVWHRASGWVKEIARKSEDQVTEAEFDPETRVVTVYEGRREFTAGAVGDTRGIQGGSDCRVCAASHARGRGGRERGVRVCSQTDPESQATRGAAVGPTEYAAAMSIMRPKRCATPRTTSSCKRSSSRRCSRVQLLSAGLRPLGARRSYRS